MHLHKTFSQPFTRSPVGRDHGYFEPVEEDVVRHGFIANNDPSLSLITASSLILKSNSVLCIKKLMNTRFPSRVEDLYLTN